MNVLIVDDNDDARIILRKNLECNGYTIQDAFNGADALSKAKDSPPDMIISDILMPEMDGYKLCREFKQNKKLRKIPFIFYTSTYTTPKDEKFAEALGATRFIVKPMEPAKLLEIINTVALELKEHTLHVPRMPMEDDSELSRVHSEIVSTKLNNKIKDLDSIKETLQERERKLNAAEIKYRKLIETANDAIIISDAETGIITDANWMAEELTGIPLDQLKEMLQLSLHPEEDIKDCNNFFRKSITTGHAISKTLHILHTSGRRVPVEISASVVDIGGRKITQSIIRNISDRVKSERELLARLNQQAIVADLGQQALSNIDRSELLESVSARLARHFRGGYISIMELCSDGKHLELRTGTGWESGLIGSVKVKTGKNSLAGYTLLSDKPVIVEDMKNETRFSPEPLLLEHNIESSMSVILFGANRPFGVISVHSIKRRKFNPHDVNFLTASANVLAQAMEHRRAKEGLKLFRDLIDHSSDAIFIINPLTSIILDANDTACTNLGYTHHELLEMKLDDIETSRSESHTWHQYVKKVKESGKLTVQARQMKKDGKMLSVELNVQYISKQGNDYMVAIARDITKRLKMEKQLNDKIHNLEQFYKMAVGRQLNMKELKENIHSLQSRQHEHKHN